MMKPSNRLNLAASLLLAVAAALFWLTTDRDDDAAMDAGPPRDPEGRIERPRPRAGRVVEVPAPAALRDMGTGEWDELLRGAKVPGDVRGEIRGLAAELDQIAEAGGTDEERLAYVEAIRVLLADAAPGIARRPSDAR